MRQNLFVVAGIVDPGSFVAGLLVVRAGDSISVFRKFPPYTTSPVPTGKIGRTPRS
jgi:hypothetical protein